MDTVQTIEVARALLSTHGGRAVAEAARKMREAKAAGHMLDAAHWEAIHKAIEERSGLSVRYA
ncbi:MULTISPECIES: hypothetical protein [Roseovarius]|uniref:Uncharacterized protein n=2 Tax=Roseovarius TaxID=74030 RepID=A0ABZ2HJL0_9RHOB|nr:hypothetical protein [Roseovarius sp. W115]MDV2929406.1 hypothetical protein [Roseovarius sp. W115]